MYISPHFSAKPNTGFKGSMPERVTPTSSWDFSVAKYMIFISSTTQEPSGILPKTFPSDKQTLAHKHRVEMHLSQQTSYGISIVFLMDFQWISDSKSMGVG